MKAINILAFALIATAASAEAGRFKKTKRQNNRAEKNAAREDFHNHQKDTHGGFGEVGKDNRPADLNKYLNASIQRIKVLLKAGKITEKQGTEFKAAHSEIVTNVKASKAAGELTSGKKRAYHNELAKLSDSINKVVTDGDEGDKRTALLNSKQHRLEEKIDFGLKSGRLSKGKASQLKRDLDRLAKMEARYKNGATLSDRERTKLHKEILEIKKEIHKELRD